MANGIPELMGVVARSRLAVVLEAVLRVARFGCLPIAWLARVLLAVVVAAVLPALCGLAVLAVAWIGVCVVTGGDRWTQEAASYPLIITGLVLFGAGYLPGAVLGKRTADYLLYPRRRSARAPVIGPNVEAARSHFAPGSWPQDTDAIRSADEGVREDGD